MNSFRVMLIMFLLFPVISTGSNKHQTDMEEGVWIKIFNKYVFLSGCLYFDVDHFVFLNKAECIKSGEKVVVSIGDTSRLSQNDFSPVYPAKEFECDGLDALKIFIDVPMDGVDDFKAVSYLVWNKDRYIRVTENEKSPNKIISQICGGH